MKLSSAFDESSLLSGCSGKASPVMDEVAAATGTHMSYLDKSNAMRMIDSTDYVPVDSFNGVFSLSDESGVNTFAYGGAGTIYGCFNYSNQNIASYSKTYAGSTIIASAYAVADLGSADGDTSNPDSDANDLATQEGILIGASKDGLHVYTEDGSAKAWNALKLEDSSDEIEVYNLFAVDRTFFAACRIGSSAGLLVFNASAVSKTDGKISKLGWKFVYPPNSILEHSGNCSRISFIRKISFTIGTKTIDAYSMAYSKQDGNGSYAVLFNEMSNNWEWIEMEWPGTGMVAGLVPINNASFPEMVGTTDNGDSSSEQTFDPGEDIPLINTSSISIVPLSQVEASWKNITNNSNIEPAVEALKLKTENGYAVLAVIADSTDLASLNADGVEEMDKGKENLFIFKNTNNENRWLQRRPWVVLDSTDPLPKHLESGNLYTVKPKMSSIAAGTGSEFHAHWQEAFQVIRKEGVADIAFESPEHQNDWTIPEGSVQLFNDTAESSAVSLTIDIQDVLNVDAIDPDTMETITAERELQEAWLCISRSGSELQAPVWFDNIMDAENYPYVWKWDGRAWTRVQRPETGTMRGYFDTSGVLVQSVSKAYAAVPVKLNDVGIPISVTFGKPSEEAYSEFKMLRAAAELQEIEGRKCIVADISVAGFEIPWFNKQVEFKIILKHSYDGMSSKSVLTHIAYDGNQKWIARTGGGSALCTQRILYSQTGIFSGTGNSIEGNRVSCTLSMQNSSDAWEYSISGRDKAFIENLAGEGREGGIEILKQHSFKSNFSSTPHNATLFVGTAFLAADSNGLFFSKVSADSARTADLIPVNSFEPQMKIEETVAAFNGTFNWTKQILDGTASIEGTLQVSIPSVTVCDGANYEGNWNEYFVNSPYLPADPDKTYCLVDAEGFSGAFAYTYGTADILNGNTLEKTAITEIFGNSEEYAFHHADGYGCIAPIQFDGANRPNLGTAIPFRQVKASAKNGGRKMVRLLASNCMWTLPKEGSTSSEISTASLTDQNAAEALTECALPCLNFHLDPLTSEAKESFLRFVHGDTSTLADDHIWKDCGILTTVTVEMQTETIEEDGIEVERQYQTLHLVAQRCPEADAPDIQDSDSLKTYRNFSLETGCPVWIDGVPYWLDLNDFVDNLASTEEPVDPNSVAPDTDPTDTDPTDTDPTDTGSTDTGSTDTDPTDTGSTDTDDPDAANTDDPDSGSGEGNDGDSSNDENSSDPILADLSYRLVRISNLDTLNELVDEIDPEGDLHQEDASTLFPNFPSSTEDDDDDNENSEENTENDDEEEQAALLYANLQRRVQVLSTWLCNYADGRDCIQDFEDIILEKLSVYVLDDRFDLLMQFGTAYDENIPVLWTPSIAVHSVKTIPEAMDIENPKELKWTYLKNGTYTLVSFLPSSDHKVRMEAVPLTLASLTVPEQQIGVSENDASGNISSALSRKALNASVDSVSPKMLTMDENGKVKFNTAISSGDVPYIQYASLKQWNKSESGSLPKVVVKKRPAASGVGNASAWDLYEEHSLRYEWTQWDTSRYEGGNIPFIYDSGSWPIFVPKLGAIYYVTQRHMTASPKYTPGYYAYINDSASSLSKCYAKFPSFASRSGAEDGASYWDDWLSSIAHTYVLALGITVENSISVGKAYAAKVFLPSASADWIDVQKKQGGEIAWIQGGTFKLSDAVLLPSMNSTFDAIIDECNSSRKIAFCVDIKEANSASGSTIGQRIYREMSTTFSIPRICGLFEKSSSNETIFGITKMMDSFGSANAYDVQVETVPIPGDYAQFKSLSVKSSGIIGTELEWIWEAAITPRDVSTEGNSSWLIGYYGTAHISYPNSANTSYYATTTCTGVYASTVKSEMLKIKSPELDAQDGSEDEDIVFYNQQGFYVKVKRNKDGGDSSQSGGGSEGTNSSPASLSGSESMASKRAIIDMTAVKAYNSPIIMGLYETGGLILYYGQKCFDDSILSVNRLAEGTADDELNTIRIKTEDWMKAVEFDGTVDEDDALTQDDLDEMYAAKAKARDILDMWLPNEASEIQAVAASFNATATQRSHIASKLAYAAGRTSANISLSSSETRIYNVILKHCLGSEAKAETIAEADRRFIESCEYSPNNSETSQWIDIPIYIRNRQTGEIEEPKEELTTLSTSVQNGRIRVSVGSTEGNVYYRDLNPLHADKYISYIPLPYLSDSEQQEIRTSLSSGLDYKGLGTENLKNFIKPATTNQQSSTFATQAIKIGWLQQEWQLNESVQTIDQNKFIALQNSKASIAKDSRLWLYDRNTDLKYRFEANDPRTDKVNGNAYMPYVKERTWNWVIGETKTKIKAYANIPYVEKRSGRLEWAVVDAKNGNAVFHTGIRAEKGIYPSIVKFNDQPCWSFGGKTDFGTGTSSKTIEVVSNGVPYVTENEWLIREYGKTEPTRMGIVSSDAVQMTAVIDNPVDHWYIDPAPSSSSQNAVDLNYATEAAKSIEVSFKAKQKQFWKLTNVQRVLDNGNVQAASASYITDIEVKNGETMANCPYVLQEAKKIVVDNRNESPVWRSKSNISLAKLGNLFLKNSGSNWTIASANGSLTETLPAASSSNGLSPYWMGKSGKSFWLPPEGAPDSTEIPYSNDASPVSTIGSRWTSYSQSFNEDGKRDERTWELIGVASNDVDKFVPKDVNFGNATWNVWTVDGKYLHASISSNGKLVCTTSATADKRYVCRTDDWQKPKLAKGNADVWQWKMRKPNGTFINGFTVVTESSEYPYNIIEEVCVWKNGKIVENVMPDPNESLQLKIADAVNENGDPILQWNAIGYDWSMEYEEPPAGQPEIRVVPSWTGRRCTFQWQVYRKTSSNENWTNAVQTSSATQCPLVKTAKKSWQVIDSNGKWIDTGISVSLPLVGKGLETDGISEIRTSQTLRSHSEKRWVSGDETEKSWTPLASIFVDAFEEVSEGVLGSIKTPYYKKEGMIWDVMPAEELFDSDNGSGESVHISDEANNTWNEYVESPEGNKSGDGYTIYIGWQVVTGTQKYNNYCTIVSSSTGAMFKWKQNNKDWRFEKVEIVNRKDGSIDKIVIMCSQGWIVASGPISYVNNGKEIKAIEWQTAVNPVKKVLNKLNDILAYKWKSWTSNTYGEFAAVGTSGIYVYSPDCINFEASMPYGIEAEMLEVVWNETNGEFIIRAIAPTVGDGSGQTVTPEEEEQEVDFEMEHALQLDKITPGGKALSVSLLSDEVIYKHKHKNCSGKTETLWYKFSPSLSYFEEIPSNSPDLTPNAKAGAEIIIPDNQYKWIANGYTWSWVYTKRDAKGKALGSGYTGKKGEKWYWMWGSSDAEGSENGSLSYITISKNRKKVAYGFPDLIRFIRSYKKIYTESMEFLGGVSTFITSERESVDEARKALMVSYKELAEMGSSGLEMYSPKLQVAYGLYLQAKELRDDSHYAQNDCWDTYLQKIGQSLALEHKDFFNKAKRAMWTAQAFRNYYESLAKKAGG